MSNYCLFLIEILDRSATIYELDRNVASEIYYLFAHLGTVYCVEKIFFSFHFLRKQIYKEFSFHRRRRLESIHSRSDTDRTGAEGLSFYYPRLLHCLDQMLAVMSLSQHRVSSSKIVRPRAPCGARCIRHAVSTWFAVCSQAPHSQFGEGARLHLCMDEWNRPTPVRRRLSLTQAARGKPIPTGL